MTVSAAPTPRPRASGITATALIANPAGQIRGAKRPEAVTHPAAQRIRQCRPALEGDGAEQESMSGTVRCPGYPLSLDPSPAQPVVNGALKGRLVGCAQAGQFSLVGRCGFARGGHRI